MSEYTPYDEFSTIEDNETLICEKCGYVNLIKNIPFKRRITRNRQIPLDDAVYDFLKKISFKYKSINVGLQYLIRDYQTLKSENENERN
ncbi:MAG: hypothetical protein DA328_08935 [Nitrososphaeraceae archaeon]|nr:hypothetical protein [Nitrososphaeraceae archaeon]